MRHRLYKWQRSILVVKICFDYVTLLDDSSSLSPRQIVPIWLWKFTFHFFFSISLLHLQDLRGSSSKYRRSIIQAIVTFKAWRWFSCMPLRYDSLKVNPDFALPKKVFYWLIICVFKLCFSWLKSHNLWWDLMTHAFFSSWKKATKVNIEIFRVCVSCGHYQFDVSLMHVHAQINKNVISLSRLSRHLTCPVDPYKWIRQTLQSNFTHEGRQTEKFVLLSMLERQEAAAKKKGQSAFQGFGEQRETIVKLNFIALANLFLINFERLNQTKGSQYRKTCDATSRWNFIKIQFQSQASTQLVIKQERPGTTNKKRQMQTVRNFY